MITWWLEESRDWFTWWIGGLLSVVLFLLAVIVLSVFLVLYFLGWLVSLPFRRISPHVDESWTTQPEICYNCSHYFEIGTGEKLCFLNVSCNPPPPENCPRMRAEFMNDRREVGK